MIGNDLSIEGQSITIRCQGLLTVNGDINADIHSKQLDVGREGSIAGSVCAENVEVHGKVTGAIHSARVVLHPTADVEGDIHTQFLTIQEGASFDGRSRKVRDLAEVAPRLERGSGAQPVYQQPGHQSGHQAQPAGAGQPQRAQDAPKPQFGVALACAAAALLISRSSFGRGPKPGPFRFEPCFFSENRFTLFRKHSFVAASATLPEGCLLSGKPLHTFPEDLAHSSDRSMPVKPGHGERRQNEADQHFQDGREIQDAAERQRQHGRFGRGAGAGDLANVG